ncbi:hypothetical protein HELRODRAFT_192604 [Helobdella robusta]|uniref:Uncharacterized protein n=1 Tax=Helobdella robusta TaxID=6412 RepID=T1FU43_HELRO|nr:hypothetical protein HELRODRAFT_192604 [Helobdella robusta]ESO00361.1 hypothetical protein HELRODRAFT_192604 [Helobdella robusta]
MDCHSNRGIAIAIEDTRKIFNYLDDVSLSRCLRRCEDRVEWNGEENIFCCPYNSTIIVPHQDGAFKKRTVTMNSETIVVTVDKRFVVLLNEPFHTLNASDSTLMTCHVASITKLVVDRQAAHVITSSYDSTIRKWCLVRKKCIKLFTGHADAVNCIHQQSHYLASGSSDKTCKEDVALLEGEGVKNCATLRDQDERYKLWNVETGRCLWTSRLQAPVTAVQIQSIKFCFVATSTGCINIFEIKTGKSIKKIKVQTCSITCLKLSSCHMAASATNGVVTILSWNVVSNEPAEVEYDCNREETSANKCQIEQHTNNDIIEITSLCFLKHNKRVQCLELIDEEPTLISGSDDGFVRLWIRNSCIRILYSTQFADPISQVIVVENKLLINSTSTVTLLTFKQRKQDGSIANQFRIKSSLSASHSASPRRPPSRLPPRPPSLPPSKSASRSSSKSISRSAYSELRISSPSFLEHADVQTRKF